MAKKKSQLSKAPQYLVRNGTSVRKTIDPADPDEYIDYQPGDVVSDPPKHADVEGWLASGHWELIEPEASNG